MQLTSKNFDFNKPIPSKYTCDGEGINPSLDISDVPEGTKSLALIVHDPDAPKSGGFLHWLVWSIDPTTKEIQEGEVPPSAIEGISDSGEIKWVPPCPNSGTHHYHFILYALSNSLDLVAGASRQEFESAISGKVLAKAELVGTYEKNK